MQGRQLVLRRRRPVRPGGRIRRPARLRQARRGGGRGPRPDRRPHGGAELLGRGHRPRARGLRDARRRPSTTSSASCSTMSTRRHGSSSCSATRASRSASTATSGIAAPTSHRPAYEIPFLIRHPDGEKVGRRRGLVRLDARRGAHDPVLHGRDHPGQDGRRGPHRAVRRRGPGGPLPTAPKRSRPSGSNIIVRDSRWLMVADRERDRAPDVRRRRRGRGRHHALRQHRERGSGQAHRAVARGADRGGRHAARVRPRRRPAPAARARRRRHRRRRHPERLRPDRQRRARGRRHGARGPRVRRPHPGGRRAAVDERRREAPVPERPAVAGEAAASGDASPSSARTRRPSSSTRTSGGSSA